MNPSMNGGAPPPRPTGGVPVDRVEAAAIRAYGGLWGILVRWFRVPEAPPSLPVQPGEQALSFRPAPSFLRYLQLQFAIVFGFLTLGVVVLWIVATVGLVAADLWFLAIPLVPVAVLLIIVPAGISFVGIQLRFDTTWYVLTRRSIRARNGIWIISEMTLTFENVQNVHVMKGPLQRLFGIATVIVDTAGGGMVAGKHGATIAHRLTIDGISNADEIRDLIMTRVRASTGAGLGDDHDHGHERGTAPSAGRSPASGRTGTGSWSRAHLAVLREIRDELAAGST